MILRKGIELHGFDSERQVLQYVDLLAISVPYPKKKAKILYQGKLSEVTEEQAKEWVEKAPGHKRYKNYAWERPLYVYAISSLKSATDKEWIIITSHE